MGTYKGRGTTPNGDTSDCPSHYTPADWTGYVDYSILGIYNCYSFCTDCYHTGYNPSFVILYNNCPGVGNRWVMTYAGTQRKCIVGSSSGVRTLAALETTPLGTQNDYNIDVKYTNMQSHFGAFWNACVGNTQPGYADAAYHYAYVSNCAWNVYLGTLD